MSNRRLTPNQLQTSHRRLSLRARTVIAATLLSGGVLFPGMMAWANGPAPGTVIENQATGSFVDPSDSSTKLIESNVVQVTVAEVAGITVTDNGYNEPTDGTVNEGDTVYFDFVITNVGNDPTQFVLPGAATVTGGTANGDIQVIEYDPDGTGTAAVDLSSSNITVPSGGEATGNLLNSVANTNNGSVPTGGSITVRVPVTTGTAGFDLTVTLGNTAATNGQNEDYVAGTNDVYTGDNTGTANGDTDGDPINGEREASDSLTVEIASTSLPTPTPGQPQCLLPQNLVTDGSFDSGLTFFPSTGAWTSPTRQPSVINPSNEPTGTIANGYPALGNRIGYNENDSADDSLLVTPTFEVDQTYLNGQLDIWFDTYWRHAGGGGSKDSTLELRVNGTPYWQMRTINGEGGGSSTIIPLNGATMSPGSPTGLSNPGGGGAFSQWGNVHLTIPYTSNATPQIEFAMKGRGLASDDFGIDRIYAPVCLPDRGDAPDSYSTDITLGNSGGDLIGPFHRIVNDLRIGTSPDGEIDAEVPLDGTGDGADEDGITLANIDPNATTYNVSASNIDVTNNSGLGAATLHAWIDFDGSGTFETDEYTSQTVASGTTGGNPNGPLSWSGPGVSGLTNGATTYARFRLTTDNSINAATPGGEARDGEVEDYQVAIASPIFNISGTVYDDDNLNNIFDASEPKMPADITVRLLSSDGSVEIATTMTNANGDYSFSDIAPGTYQIQLESTDPDITVGYSLGTPNPLTVTVSSSYLIDNNFGFDNPRAGTGFSPFCVNTYGEVYVGQGGGGGNRIYAIQGDTGAVTTLTNSALATPNSLATDFVTRTVYYAEGSGIYGWDAINNTHQRLADLNGNTNARTMPGSTVVSLSSGGAAFYDGSLYLGSDPAASGRMEIYRVDFVPGSDGKTVQSITALGINGPSGANGALNNGDWGDFIIGDNGVIYASSGGSARFWSYDLSTGNYQDLVDTYSTPSQLAKDGQGRLFALPNAGASATTIIQIEIVGNTIQTVGSSSSISPARGFDAAECVIGRSTIGDRVWDDLDGDGIQDPLEPGIANVTVGLYRDIDADGVLDAGDPLLGTQLTNNNGNYDFVDLIFGNYIIKVLEGTPNDLDGTNLVDGAVITTANSPGGEDPVTLPTGIVDYNDADFGYQLPIIPKDPNVLLVKRITQINGSTDSAGGDDLSGYIDQSEAINPYDDNDITVADPVDPTDPPKDTDLWPTPLTATLVGGIDGGNVMPNDEIEYTIYYLSSGDATAESVLFCDYVPSFTSFIPNAYTAGAPQALGGIGGADLSIELFRNGTTDYHTGANDGDSATYFSPGTDPGTSFPGIDCDGDSDGINANTNGAVVVNLGDLPDATTDATGAYGYVRFRARVK